MSSHPTSLLSDLWRVRGMQHSHTCATGRGLRTHSCIPCVAMSNLYRIHVRGTPLANSHMVCTHSRHGMSVYCSLCLYRTALLQVQVQVAVFEKLEFDLELDHVGITLNKASCNREQSCFSVFISFSSRSIIIHEGLQRSLHATVPQHRIHATLYLPLPMCLLHLLLAIGSTPLTRRLALLGWRRGRC